VLGLAIDLGTTNLSLSVLDLSTRTQLAVATTRNPQAVFGADVMTRLMSAQEPAAAAELQRLAVAAIGQQLGETCAREGLHTRNIGRVAIVGNSVMLALLTAHGVDRLLDPDHWMASATDPGAPDTEWRRSWGLHESAVIDVLPALGGFVGSDVLAGILHTRLDSTTEAGMLIDFGTNSEIAVWDGGRLLVSSAAGGPAFEGVGIGCGMPAVAGAVYRVEDDGTGNWRYHTLDDVEPRGICASGLVDLIALLRAGGTLSVAGRLPRGTDQVDLPRSGFTVSHHDIDLLQRAKAAIGAGCRVLCQALEIELEQIPVLYVAGAFGSFLDTGNAASIGLLPELPTARVLMLGNTALAGCADYLHSPPGEQATRRIHERASVVNLAASPEFETLFFDQLFLRPMRTAMPAPTSSP